MAGFPDEHYDFDSEGSEIASTDSSRLLRVVRRTDGARVVMKAPLRDSAHAGARFRSEITALRTCAGPATMPVLDHADDYSWYVMPTASHTLAANPTPATVADTASILDVMAQALAPAHARGQVHRDLKPENILFLPGEPDGRWVVSDFGIVRNPRGNTTDRLTAVGRLTGTESWAAPEQHHDAHVATPSTDVFSGALVVTWMLTGVRPIYGHVEVPGDLAVAGVLDRAMNRVPEERYSTFEAFLTAYRHAIDEDLPSLDRLAAGSRFEAIHRYVRRYGSEWSTSVEVLARLTPEKLGVWAAEDRVGLAESVKTLSAELTRAPDAVRPGAARGFTRMATESVILVVGDEPRSGDELVTSVLRLLRDRGDEGSTIVLLDWLDGRDRSGDFARALHRAGAFEWFARVARRNRKAEWRSRLLADLVDQGA